MPIGDIPLWGEWGLLGLSVSLNIFFIVQGARGLLVPYNRVEDEKKNTNLWQHAWEVKEHTTAEATALVSQLTVTAKTMEKVLNALPQVESANVVVVHDERSS